MSPCYPPAMRRPRRSSSVPICPFPHGDFTVSPPVPIDRPLRADGSGCGHVHLWQAMIPRDPEARRLHRLRIGAVDPPDRPN